MKYHPPFYALPSMPSAGRISRTPAKVPVEDLGHEYREEPSTIRGETVRRCVLCSCLSHWALARAACVPVRFSTRGTPIAMKMRAVWATAARARRAKAREAGEVVADEKPAKKSAGGWSEERKAAQRIRMRKWHAEHGEQIRKEQREANEAKGGRR